MTTIARIAALCILIAIYYAPTGPAFPEVSANLLEFLTADYVQWWEVHGDGGAFLRNPVFFIVALAVLAVLAFHLAGVGRFVSSLIVAVFLVRFGLSALDYRQVDPPGLTLTFLTLMSVGFLMAEPFVKQRGLWLDRSDRG